MHTCYLILLFALMLLVTGCASSSGGAPAPVEPHRAPDPKELRGATVAMPRAWPDVIEALIAAHLQTGLRYAVVASRFEGTIGAFEPGETLSVEELLGRIGEATATKVHWVGDVAVFDPAGPTGVEGADELRMRVHRMGGVGASSFIPELSGLTAHSDPSVRFHALAALQRMEGDFMRHSWPGRLSIFEVMRNELDNQALLWVLEEGGPDGTGVWQMAVEILARSREPYLARHTWSTVWHMTGGTIRLGVWAMGRSGDESADWSVIKRLRNPGTNEPEDRYLAGLALGMLNCEGRLRDAANHSNVDVRRAAVLGLGLCGESDSLLAQLDRSLGDGDAAVRFLACQALGRIGTTRAIGRLRDIVKSGRSSLALRSAALEALALKSSADPPQEVLDAAADAEPALRAKAADLLGRIGGKQAQEVLLKLIEDEDKWVRASAACGLGWLGSSAAVERVAKFMQAQDTGDDGLIASLIGLGRGRSPEASKPLGMMATDPQRNRRLRRYAVIALAQLEDRAGQETLKSLTIQGRPEYLPLALRHLELATPEETARYLVPYLVRGMRDTPAAVACRLAELGQGEGVRELLEGFDVFDNHARMMHAWGPIRARGAEVVPTLVAASKSKRASIRKSAALGLGARRDVEAVDTLIVLTNDPSSKVRWTAAQSLGLIGDPQAIPALIRLAEEDKRQRVVSAAIRALRMRDFSHYPEVRELFAKLARTERDAGVIDPDRPSVAKQPANSFALRRYAKSLDDDAMCNITYESSVTYDSDRGRVVLWGAHGRRYDSPQTGQTWFFDARNNSWTRLVDSREWPNLTCCNRGTTYDPANQVVISPKSGSAGHGWGNRLRENLQYSVPWVMDASTDQWYAAKPVEHMGGLSSLPGSFDPRHAVVVWWSGEVRAYDAYANDWERMHRSGPGPGYPGSAGAAFDPRTGKLIAVSSNSTWAYDPPTDTWTDLKPEGRGPASCPLVYDSTNDVMLAFHGGYDGGMRVSVYHIRENRWEQMPATRPAPQYHTLDVTYDSRNNVAVISGGYESGWSAEATVRETWTYRYKPASGKSDDLPGRPGDLVVVTEAGGKARLSWKPTRQGKVVGYRVYRGIGSHPWRVKWEQITELSADQLAYTDEGRDQNKLAFYRVTAVDEEGSQGPVSYPARTAPRAVRWAAAVLTAEGINLKWETSSAGDVVGYHIYRAPADLGSPWGNRFDPRELSGKLERITEKPVKEGAFRDTDAKVEGEVTELAWPKTFAYVVRAVNAWGIEGGPSPATLALPDPPATVRVIPWLDGRRLVLWTPGRADQVRGYYVLRMDDWNGRYVFRWNASPIVEAAFYDHFEFPTADRRRYYVTGVDVLGTVGIPSSGAWSHGFP